MRQWPCCAVGQEKLGYTTLAASCSFGTYFHVAGAVNRHERAELPVSTCHTASTLDARYQAVFAAAGSRSSPGKVCRPSDAAAVPGVQSASERFATMQRTLHQRVTSGMLADCLPPTAPGAAAKAMTACLTFMVRRL